jgi:hypothetical protein
MGQKPENKSFESLQTFGQILARRKIFFLKKYFFKNFQRGKKTANFTKKPQRPHVDNFRWGKN